MLYYQHHLSQQRSIEQTIQSSVRDIDTRTHFKHNTIHTHTVCSKFICIHVLLYTLCNVHNYVMFIIMYIHVVHDSHILLNVQVNVFSIQ